MFQKIQWDFAGKTYHCNEATRIYHESIGINCKSIVYGKARLEFGDCYSFDNDHNGTVQAYLNGNEIGRTSALSKAIEFDFNNGDLLELKRSSNEMIGFNNFIVLVRAFKTSLKNIDELDLN